MSILITESEFEDPLPPQLVFEVGATRACTSIATVDDDIYEEDETFSVSLSSTSNRVVITLSSAIVQIIDNDGE